MKILLTFLFAFISIMTFGQKNYQEWQTQAQTNNRLIPKYGNIQKTKEQKEIDQQFIEETMRIKDFEGNKRMASNYMIERGFQYLNKGDLKTAMYRFNQAYLLDNENTDIYWGFGAIYMSLSNLERAKDQYQQGLKINPKNTHLLTDYATYFLTKYYEAKNSKSQNANEYLNEAQEQLSKSYSIDAKDQNTLYKLSVCYFLKKDCKNAKKFYNLCKEQGGNFIDEGYTQELFKICN